MDTLRTSVILPTYNERENLPRLVDALRPLAEALGMEVIVVDDNSPDGTAAVARALAGPGGMPIRVITRVEKAGLSSAILAGAAAAAAPVIAVMDSDGSHPPATLPALVAAVERGADVAVASRYVPQGGIEQWPLWRRVTSLVATTAARLLLGLPVRDPLSGYFAARRELLARPGYWGVGFKLLLEVLARNPALRVVEVGYRFTDRAGGRSKLSPREIGAYLRLLGRLTRRRGVRAGPAGAPAGPPQPPLEDRRS